LVGATDCRRPKHEAFRVACNQGGRCGNTLWMDSGNLTFVSKSCACTSIAFLAAIMSWPLDSTKGFVWSSKRFINGFEGFHWYRMWVRGLGVGSHCLFVQGGRRFKYSVNSTNFESYATWLLPNFRSKTLCYHSPECAWHLTHTSYMGSSIYLMPSESQPHSAWPSGIGQVGLFRSATRTLLGVGSNHLHQCFSTAGPRPGTRPWHQLYQAVRGLRKLQYATRFH
jgi:hypothetical protein